MIARAVVVLAALLAGPAWAADEMPAAPQAKFSSAQLEQLVAPIALYRSCARRLPRRQHFPSPDAAARALEAAARAGDVERMVGPEDVIFQKNLGPGTSEAAKAITAYDPDGSWEPTR